MKRLRIFVYSAIPIYPLYFINVHLRVEDYPIRYVYISVS